MPINPLEALITQLPVASEQDVYRWGTVQSDGSVLLDTDTDSLVDQPASLCEFTVGDRLLCLIHNRRATILGKAYAAPFINPSATTTTTTATAG